MRREAREERNGERGWIWCHSNVPKVGKNLMGLLLPKPTPPLWSREQAAVLSEGDDVGIVGGVVTAVVACAEEVRA